MAWYLVKHKTTLHLALRTRRNERNLK